MNKFFYYFILILIISFGIYLRFYELGFGSFWIDEGFSSIISYFSSLNNNIPILPSGNFNFSQYFFTLSQVLSFNIFGYSDFSARIPSFIFSISNIFIFYLFSKELLQNNKYKNIGIIFLMTLFLFSTWQIIWSREARFYELLALFYLILTYFLWKYLEDFEIKYFIIFIIISLFGIVFHPFCIAIFGLGIIIFISKYFYDNFIKKTVNKNFIGVIVLLIIFLLYIIINNLLSFIYNGKIDLSNSFPVFEILGNGYFYSYFSYYLQNIYSQLGVIFVFFIFGSFYFLFSKDYKKILFFIIFLINITFISLGFLAHSRYLFHTYSIITLFGGYSAFVFFTYFYEQNIGKIKKSLFSLVLLFSFLGLIFTYKFTFLPQRFYYIDSTSPKPNFKMAYEYLTNNKNYDKIVSGFPHMCYWYNLKNPEKCGYAININLIGDKKYEEDLKIQNFNYYTNTKYLNNLDEIDRKKYYFVLDDLTLKNALNKDLINDILDKCYMVYKDVGNYDSANFIGIWKCQ